MKTTCIYHANCNDGFTAAWVVRRALGEIVFHEGRYGVEPPDISGCRVILVDFSYPRAILERIAKEAESVLVLDHHKTAEADLSGLTLPNLEIVFDQNRSGAGIAWDYFFPAMDRPTFLNAVEDRDLWRFALEGTREICAAMYSYEQTFENWDRFDFDSSGLYSEGVTLDRAHLKNVKAAIDISKRRVTLGGYNVPMANVPVMFSSDAGNMLAQREAFSVTYCDTAKSRLFSLRSTDEGIDCSEIAKMYGGGGHRNAAGFKVGREHELAAI